ncbi:hypothetical protein VT98_12764, partial [Candidatus Electrothrix communis]
MKLLCVFFRGEAAADILDLDKLPDKYNDLLRLLSRYWEGKSYLIRI